MVRSKSVLNNYGGRWLTIAKEATVVDGDWPMRKTIAILSFPNRERARMWFQSDPIAKQQDWLGGVDVVIVPLQYTAPREKDTFVLLDAGVMDEERFLNEYVNAQIDTLRENGASCYVVASKVHENLRGLWVPRFIVMHQFPSYEGAVRYYRNGKFPFNIKKGIKYQLSFSNSIETGEYGRFANSRFASSVSTLVIFRHEACDLCERIG